MKFIRAIIKNFKVLFRLKAALIAIIFGPLFVIFLIGFAFNSTNAIQLTVGYNAPDDSVLTTDFITNLEDKYTTKSFLSGEDCVEELKHGLVHTCIFFPKDFVISKGKVNNLTFVVDKSRVNLAYTVIEGVSEQIGIKSDELSKDLTQTLTSTLTKTGTIIDNNIGSLIKIKKDMTENIKDVDQINSDLDNIDLEVQDISFSGTSIIASVDTNLDDIKDEVKGMVALNIPLLEAIGDNSTDPIVDSLNDLDSYVLNKHNVSTVSIAELTTKLSTVQIQINNMEEQLTNAKKNTDSSKESITNLKSNINSVFTSIESVKGDLEDLSRDINSIEITSSDQIINPISTKIETISSDSNQLISLLPYLLMLIIMFVSLMLASTLVVVEKSSRASFRVFTTPTKDEFFILTTFVTAFIIVLTQLAVILFATSYFLIDVFTANLELNILLLVLSTTIFIMIGMAIGYLIKSQQGANMTSISVGALFLMVSNFVLPVESIIPALQAVAQYNPFVLASETLRRSTLFNMPLHEMLPEVSILLGISIAIFIIIIIFQKLSKARYFKRNQHARAKKIKEIKGLWIRNILVYNEQDFIQEITKLSEENYNSFVKRHSIKIKKFIIKELNKPDIAKKIRTCSKKELLDMIIKEKQDIIEDIKKKHEIRVNNTKSKK